MIIPQTSAVALNEPCYGLREMPFKTADEREIHRFQLIYVVRDDRIAEFRTDLGLWTGSTGIHLPGWGDDTVAEVRAIAEQLRNEDNQWIKQQLEEARSKPMGAAWLEQNERNKALVANRSVFGSHHTTQRNGFSRRF